jgi:hypothetical protein
MTHCLRRLDEFQIDYLQVNDLAAVFRDDYLFEVEQQVLGERNPQHQMNLFLSNFLYNHDDPGTLLIIYYAGHGWSHWNKGTDKGREFTLIR